MVFWGDVLLLTLQLFGLWGAVEKRVDAITVGVAATHLHIGLEYAMFLPLLVNSSFKQEKT